MLLFEKQLNNNNNIWLYFHISGRKENFEKKRKRVKEEKEEEKPGSAMNASACRAISALRWCMPDTALTSPTLSPVI